MTFDTKEYAYRCICETAEKQILAEKAAAYFNSRQPLLDLARGVVNIFKDPDRRRLIPLLTAGFIGLISIAGAFTEAQAAGSLDTLPPDLCPGDLNCYDTLDLFGNHIFRLQAAPGSDGYQITVQEFCNGVEANGAPDAAIGACSVSFATDCPSQEGDSTTVKCISLDDTFSASQIDLPVTEDGVRLQPGVFGFGAYYAPQDAVIAALTGQTPDSPIATTVNRDSIAVATNNYLTTKVDGSLAHATVVPPEDPGMTESGMINSIIAGSAALVTAVVGGISLHHRSQRQPDYIAEILDSTPVTRDIPSQQLAAREMINRQRGKTTNTPSHTQKGPVHIPEANRAKKSPHTPAYSDNVRKLLTGYLLSPDKAMRSRAGAAHEFFKQLFLRRNGPKQ